MTYGQYGKPKQCQNNCGQEIAWDKQANYFINTSNSQRHDCPKWEKKSSGFTPNTSNSGEQSILTEIREQNIHTHQRIDKLEQLLSMLQWMEEKLAKKVGVEDLTDDTKQ